MFPPSAPCSAARHSVTQCSHAKQTDGRCVQCFSKKKKKSPQSFLRSPGELYLNSTLSDMRFKKKLKKQLIHGPGPGLRVSLLPPSLQSRPDSERYCVADCLFNASVHLLYRRDVCWDVGSGTRNFSFFSVPRGSDGYR